MTDFWNSRYSATEYAYGTAPNEFFKDQIDMLNPGRILLPAEGEGRNAAYAASVGWDVTAFDNSNAGYHKAIELAKARQVSIRYFVDGFEEVKLQQPEFDALALIYAHVPSQKRTPWFEKMIQLLKPGAHVIFEGFSIDQLRFNSGGPRSNEMLFTEETILDIFQSLSNIQVWKEVVQLKEGQFHNGRASVIRMVGEK